VIPAYRHPYRIGELQGRVDSNRAIMAMGQESGLGFLSEMQGFGLSF